MMLIVGAMLLAGIAAGAWVLRRRSPRSAGPVRVGPREALPATSMHPAAPSPGPPGLDVLRVQTAGSEIGERLWKLAFASPLPGPLSELIDGSVRSNVSAMLQVDTLDEKYFPRRPTLLPQLLQAVNDPRAASEKIARIISRDPVLAADVLRLANSSLHRTSPEPIESIQRALVICGVEALRGMLASAMLQPAFRATRRNFPRLPRMLWERTERATRAAESYALEFLPEDRFEAQLIVLMRALGPLAVYGAALDVYARNPEVAPSGVLCAALIGELAPGVSRHIACDWQMSPRVIAAMEGAVGEPLTTALHVGELLGTLSFLESQTVLSNVERCAVLSGAGLDAEWVGRIYAV